MQHIVFAKFSDPRRAQSGLRRLSERKALDTEIVLHQGAEGEAEFSHSVQHSGEQAHADWPHAIRICGLTGAGAGALLGMLLAGIELFPGTLWQGALFGLLMGILIGLLVAAIVGGGLTDRRLKRLTKDIHAQEVVVTVKAQSSEEVELARRILTDNGAEIEDKSIA